MTNKVTIDDKNIATVDIEVKKDVVENLYNRTIKAYSEHINIPGFRKGKAPRNIVESQVGLDRIKAEIIDRIFPSEFQKVVDENKLNIAFRPTLEKVDFEVGKDLKITAKVELKPEVKIGQYKDLTVEFEEFKNEEDAVDKELKEVQRRFAKLEKTDKKATDKDTVVIDFEGFLGEEKIEHGDGKNYTLDLAHSNFIPGFAEKIVGHGAGEEFSIDVEFPKDYHDDKLKGAKATFKINLHEVKNRILPEIDDELAKLARKKDLEDLKQDIQRYLDTTAKNQNDRVKSDLLFQKIYDATEIEIQPTMLAREYEAIVEEARAQAKSQGVDYDKIIEEKGKEDSKKQLEEEAVKRIKNSLIIEKIANEEAINVDNKDIMEYINTTSRMYGIAPNQMFEQVRQNPGFYASMTQQIIATKVNDFLLENNKFNAK